MEFVYIAIRNRAAAAEGPHTQNSVPAQCMKKEKDRLGKDEKLGCKGPRRFRPESYPFHLDVIFVNIIHEIIFGYDPSIGDGLKGGGNTEKN